MGEAEEVAVTSEVCAIVNVEALLTRVEVGTDAVGVVVAGKRTSGVMVGTGDERTACSVDMRSCG